MRVRVPAPSRIFVRRGVSNHRATWMALGDWHTSKHIVFPKVKAIGNVKHRMFALTVGQISHADIARQFYMQVVFAQVEC